MTREDERVEQLRLRIKENEDMKDDQSEEFYI